MPWLTLYERQNKNSGLLQVNLSRTGVLVKVAVHFSSYCNFIIIATLAAALSLHPPLYLSDGYERGEKPFVNIVDFNFDNYYELCFQNMGPVK